MTKRSSNHYCHDNQVALDAKPVDLGVTKGWIIVTKDQLGIISSGLVDSLISKASFVMMVRLLLDR